MGGGMERLQAQTRALTGLMSRFFVGFGAVAGVRAATRTIAGFEETMATLQGVTGIPSALDERFQALTETARDLGAATRFSAREAGDGLLFLSRAGFTAEESIQAIPSTLDLASAGAIELGTAADIASNAVKQFGLEADQTARVSDVLVNTANSANTNILQLAEALKLAGPFAAATGNSIEETAAALGALGDAGIQASMAGTNVRGVLAALLDPTDKARQSFKELGLEYDEIDPKSRTLIEIFEAFRQKNLDAGDAVRIFGRRNAVASLILSDSVGKMRELTDENNRAAGTARRNAALIENTLAGSFRSLRSAIEEAFLVMGDQGFGGGLKSIVDNTRDVIRVIFNMDAEIATLSENTVSNIDRIVIAAEMMSNSFQFFLSLMGDAFARYGGNFGLIVENLELLWDTFATGIRDDWGIKLDEMIELTKRHVNTQIALIQSLEEILSVPLTRMGEIADAISSISFESVPKFATSFTLARVKINKAFDFERNIDEAISGIKQQFETDFIGGLADIGVEAGTELASGIAVALKQASGVGLADLFDPTAFFAEIERRAQHRAAQRRAERDQRKQREALEPLEAGVGIPLASLMGEPDRLQEFQRAVEGVGDDADETGDKIVELTEKEKLLRDVTLDVSSSMADAFTDAIFGAENLGDTFRRLALDLSQMVVRMMILRGLTAGFGALGVPGLTPAAKGVAMVGGRVINMQRGGIITQPTLTPLPSGHVVRMAEKADEVVAPIMRDSQGRMGVSVAESGGKTVNLNMTVVTKDADSFRKSRRQIVNDMRQKVAEEF
jgi:TP901 family phage tail tape measure protein